MAVRRVFLGAQLLGDADRRRAAVAELAGATDTDIAARLAADGGYTALGELDAQRAAHVGAAYRHDCVSAHRYFLDLLDAPPTTKLAAPVTVVVAADDPSTARLRRAARRWRLLADEVDLHELADGGHYFLRTRPAEAAEAVLRADPTCSRSVLSRQLKGHRMSSSSPPSRSRCARRPASRRCCGPRHTGDAAGWAAAHRDALRATVLEHGVAPGPRARPA